MSIQPFDLNNQRLLDNVHPANWINPEPKARYHLAVIGAGTAGLVCAAGAASLGAKVALIERAYLGGDCLNFGCVPSKALLRSARAIAEARSAAAFGVRIAGDVRIDFAAIMERMRKLRAEISPNDSVQRFRGLGVDVFLGDARFEGPDRVRVANKSLSFRRAIVATGTRPTIPPIPGLADAGYLTNESVFALTELPARLIVLGAGPIGCELAQAFARFGSRVVLICKDDRILKKEDAGAAQLIAESLLRDGVEIRYSTSVSRVERTPAGLELSLQAGAASDRIAGDALLISVGRTPNLEGLGLDLANVAADHKLGVIVNDRLQSSNGRIFAAGDVCSRFPFTHAADAYARIAVQNALFYGRARVSALTIPWCTYTDPELAHIGMNEENAKRAGMAIDTFSQEFRHVDRAVLDGDTDGFAKIHVKRGTDVIVGGTIVNRHAGDLIGELSLAMTAGIGLRRFASTIHPYPTHAEALKKLGDSYNKTRLTPTLKWLLQKWFQWT